MQLQFNIPLGLCQCGCGQSTILFRGHPRRFIDGHQGRYRVCTVIDRFWAKVQKTETCGLWTGPPDKDGYGVLHRGPTKIKAHRLSYELHYGPFSPSLNVCHHCDNPPCVNPAHLFLGTDATNKADQIAKGRMQRGSNRASAKLTETDVLIVRERYAAGTVLGRELAAEYGVAKPTIYNIVHRRKWKHI